MAIELAVQSPRKRVAKREVKGPLTNDIAIVGLRDRFSTYTSRGLSPERLASLLVEADGGDIYHQMELFEEILEKDAHMFSLFQTRRLAVTGKNYNIIPASQDQRDVDLASDVESMLSRVNGWNRAVADILDCVPKGFSVQEVFWKAESGVYTVERLRWRHQKKFRFGMVSNRYSDPEELRLIIEPGLVEGFKGIIPDGDLARASTDGVSLDCDPRFRSRFAVSLCQARSGNPARTSIMRTLTYLFLFKNYDVKWWIQFAEKLLGYTIGKYDSNQPEQKALLKEAVLGLSTDASAVISNTSSIEFAEMMQKASSHQVYDELQKWCSEEMSKAVLGHTGTSQSTPGKLGSEDAAREVKREILEADAKVLDETITDEIIVPYINYNRGPQDAYPYYRTDITESPNLVEEIQIDEGLQRMGFPITQKYAMEKYGRPLPDPKNAEDAVLQPLPTAQGLPSTGTSSLLHASGKKKLLTGR